MQKVWRVTNTDKSRRTWIIRDVAEKTTATEKGFSSPVVHEIISNR